MNASVEGVPLNDILVFPFRDSQSVRRFLPLAALGLAGFVIPILPGLFSSGYLMRILQRAIREGKVEMPEWSDETRLLTDGILSTLIGLIYLLPGAATMIAGMILYQVSLFLIIPFLNSAEDVTMFAIFLPMIILTACITIGMILLWLGSIPLPVALCRYADEGRFGAAFGFGDIFRALKANPVGYFAAWVVVLGLFYLQYFVFMLLYFTVILCCPGYVLLMIGIVAASCVFLAMVGLAYRQGKAAANAGPQAP
jgi:hypothetical protein